MKDLFMELLAKANEWGNITQAQMFDNGFCAVEFDLNGKKAVLTVRIEGENKDA